DQEQPGQGDRWTRGRNSLGLGVGGHHAQHREVVDPVDQEEAAEDDSADQKRCVHLSLLYSGFGPPSFTSSPWSAAPVTCPPGHPLGVPLHSSNALSSPPARIACDGRQPSWRERSAATTWSRQ